MDHCDSYVTCKAHHDNKDDGKVYQAILPFLAYLWIGFSVASHCQKRSSCRHSAADMKIGPTYLLVIISHRTSMVSSSKEIPPLDYKNKWLATHRSKDDKYSYIICDLGSELGRNAQSKDLIARNGYKLEPTAPGSSL